MVPLAQPLIAELDAVLELAADSWRGNALRRLIDLFAAGAGSYTPEQVAVFDEVLARLMEKIDRQLLVDVSNKLAAIENAPVKVVGKLARHSDFSVAEPVLTRSKALSDKDLAEIIQRAQKKDPLLSTVAQRPQLGHAATDALIQSGNRAIIRKILNHPGAQISEVGFAKLIGAAEGDKELATMMAERADLPPELRPWIAAALVRHGVQPPAASGG
jgi:uncharacterized protein (DUF2336 family)